VAEFPVSPIPPSEFLEGFLPRAFAEADVPDEVKQVDVLLGVKLEGAGGGEWLVQVENGVLRVRRGSREEAAFTLVQSVEDWRGALWQGRGGAIGKGASAVFRPGAAMASGGPGGLAGAPSPAALAAMRSLQGLLRMVVTGGEGGDWAVAFKLGPGPIPAEPTTTLSVSAADAAAMERGELNPLEAFMAGRIQVAGDLALVMQMQAIQMQAASGAPPLGGAPR
jgi:hypothetical protein